MMTTMTVMESVCIEIIIITIRTMEIYSNSSYSNNNKVTVKTIDYHSNNCHNHNRIIISNK